MTCRALILVAEDEAALRQDITDELREAGHEVLTAADGRQALALLESGSRPDLVLCDINMPGLDGYGLLARLRQNRPDLAATSFIFLTALSEPAEVIEGKRLGADDYLVKPVDYDLMLATVAARLRQTDRIRNRHEAEIDSLRRGLAELSGPAGVKGAALDALDLFAAGVVLLDGRGRVLHANRAARDMGAEGAIMSLRADRIEAADPSSATALRRAITETIDVAREGKATVSGIVLHDIQAGTIAPATLCALPRAENTAEDQPRAALFLPPPTGEKRISEPLLMQLFELTPSEARVAAALAGGARPADLAEGLGVSPTTIAFHMRNLFQKTGTNRQADLVALIIAGPMIIR